MYRLLRLFESSVLFASGVHAVSYQAGATVADNLDPAHILVGIKETPLERLITTGIQRAAAKPEPSLIPRTHLMFSHTAKGQPYNTPLLARFIAHPEASAEDNNVLPRLIDYELLTNETDGKRTVGFGWFAGGKRFFPPVHADFN